MTTKFEYLVCQAQFERVTFVNNNWTGGGDRPDLDDVTTCPYVWDFLADKGVEGWELVCVVPKVATDTDGEYTYMQLFLKRRTADANKRQPA